jgi:hypothetical protein
LTTGRVDQTDAMEVLLTCMGMSARLECYTDYDGLLTYLALLVQIFSVSTSHHYHCLHYVYIRFVGVVAHFPIHVGNPLPPSANSHRHHKHIYAIGHTRTLTFPPAFNTTP